MPPQKQFSLDDFNRFTPPQQQAERAFYNFKYLGVGGAMGGGKSYWIRRMALNYLIYVFHKYRLTSVRVGIFCEDFPALYGRQISKTVDEFPSFLGSFVEARKNFELAPEYGSGTICFRNLNEPSKYDSEEFAAIFFDEGQKQRVTDFRSLRKRLRWPSLGDDVHFAASFNPPRPKEDPWCRDMFCDRLFPPDEKEKDKFFFVPFPMSSNAANLPPSYADQFTGNEAERLAYLEGDMHALDNAQSDDGWRPLLLSSDVKPRLTRSFLNSRPSVLGIDPAAGGDTSSIIYRTLIGAAVCFNQKTQHIMSLVPIIRTLIEENSPTDIAIDVGGVGAGLYDRLREVFPPNDPLSPRLHAVNFGSKSSQPTRYRNLKSQLYWNVRTLVLGGLVLEDDPAWSELYTSARWSEDSAGRLEMMSKDDLRKLSIPSPNVLDALAVSTYVDLSPRAPLRPRASMASVFSM